jgi:hypothetical protein
VKARTRIAVGTALAAAVLAALVMAARLGVEDPDERARRARAEEARVLDVPAAGVVGVEVSLGPEAIRLRRDADGWRMLAPEEGPADGAAVDALLERLRGLRRRAGVAAGRDPAVYGLAPPRGHVLLTLSGGRTAALDLGDDAPVGGAFYARLGGEILVVAGSASSLLPPAGSLRP